MPKWSETTGRQRLPMRYRARRRPPNLIRRVTKIQHSCFRSKRSSPKRSLCSSLSNNQKGHTTRDGTGTWSGRQSNLLSKTTSIGLQKSVHQFSQPVLCLTKPCLEMQKTTIRFWSWTGAFWLPKLFPSSAEYKANWLSYPKDSMTTRKLGPRQLKISWVPWSRKKARPRFKATHLPQIAGGRLNRDDSKSHIHVSQLTTDLTPPVLPRTLTSMLGEEEWIQENRDLCPLLLAVSESCRANFRQQAVDCTT